MKTPKMPRMPKMKMPKMPALRIPGAKPDAETDPYPDAEHAGDVLEAQVEAASGAFDKLKADIKAEQHRFEVVNDSEFWCAFCFESREQKEEFLRVFQLHFLGDKYIDGLAAARALGKPLTSPRVRFPKHRENRVWKQFVG
jgi:hypothetical protein